MLQLRYCIPVDAALVLKDDDGWHAQLRLHYYLTVGREFLKMRDSKRLHEQTEKGFGAVWKPDLNRGQMSAAVAVMENLGLLKLLTQSREFRGSDDVIQRIATIALAHAWDIKTALNITINEKDTPIAIAQKLLSKLGLKLTYLRREGSDGSRQRVYGYTAPDDGRDEVFAAWTARDEVALAAVALAAEAVTASTPVTSTPGNKDIITPPMDVTRLDADAA